MPQLSSAQLRSQHVPPGPPGGGRRRPGYRPPAGLPLAPQSRWAGPVSFATHALIIFLLVTPLFAPKLVENLTQGAGGPGPAGGGGGGRRGAGGAPRVDHERLQYVEVQAPQPVPLVPEPIVPPPELEEKPIAPQVDLQIEQPKTVIDLALTSGVGGGTGNDNSSGNGPGRGGGVGSGVGTGRGSGTGPGTGGGEGTIYPPTPDFILIPPLPIPERIKGQVLTLRFEIDERGNTVRLELVNPTRDRGFNQRLVETYKQARFRPATKWDGTPVSFVYPMQLTI